jgi:hypothetical protein
MGRETLDESWGKNRDFYRGEKPYELVINDGYSGDATDKTIFYWGSMI